MEKYQELREKAKSTLNKADHMLTMTYPMLNEPKILISVNNNMLQAMEQAMTAILEYERLFKRIPAYHEDFISKANIFRDKIIPRHGIDPKYLKLMMDLREIMKAHEESPVEFTRKSKFVMADENYHLRTITATDLKKQLNKAKLFIDEATILTRENDRVFR